MSYILDALRKADAQRGRARLPGLHAQPLGAVAADRAVSRAAPIGWAVAGVGLVSVAAVAWQLNREPAALTPAGSVTIGNAATPSSLPPQPPTSTPEAPAQAPAAAPTVADAIAPPAPPPLPAPARPAPAPSPRTDAAGERSASSDARGAATPQPGPDAARPAGGGQPAAAIASSPPPGAPVLAVSGGVYSPSPVQRMLVVNGQVFNEGSEVAAGVTLEQVRADRRAVLNFRGQRYSVPY